MSYLLDANVFISAKRIHYGLDFCPAFWDWLIHEGHTGSVFSIDKVSDELLSGHDELTDWAQDYSPHLFRRTTAALAPQFTQISDWVYKQNFTPGAINIFLKSADYYLIAHALAGGHTLVTHETFQAGANRIMIPTVCLGIGVHYLQPHQMLRTEQARFVLGGGNP